MSEATATTGAEMRVLRWNFSIDISEARRGGEEVHSDAFNCNSLDMIADELERIAEKLRDRSE